MTCWLLQQTPQKHATAMQMLNNTSQFTVPSSCQLLTPVHVVAAVAPATAAAHSSGSSPSSRVVVVQQHYCWHNQLCIGLGVPVGINVDSSCITCCCHIVAWPSKLPGQQVAWPGQVHGTAAAATYVDEVPVCLWLDADPNQPTVLLALSLMASQHSSSNNSSGVVRCRVLAAAADTPAGWLPFSNMPSRSCSGS